jgi:nucleoside-diphosphate-sugar epimerase
MPFAKPSSVLITGAGGNLGRKIIEALALEAWCTRIVGLDLAADMSRFSSAAQSKLALVTGNLAEPGAPWAEAFAGIEAVVHLAAENPNVDATWMQASNSFDQTVNVGLLAAKHGARRLVFASSNHVMGGYKDQPLAAGLSAGALKASLAPAPGTKWHDGTQNQDATAYATAKLMGERLFTGLAANSDGLLSSVSVRIGWTQTGENRAATISHAGSHIGGFPEAKDDDAKRDLRWFRNMWLANEDFTALFLAAISSDPSAWPTPGIVVNGMSNNRGMDWDVTETTRLLGYKPKHDLYAELDA